MKHHTFKVIDAHTAGEPLRVIVSGLPEIGGRSILEKRRILSTRFDWIRTALMWEPRGHADMYGCIVTEKATPDGDHGILFLHNEGYSTMCGHGIIGVVKVLIEEGLTDRGGDGNERILKLDTPAGRVTATARMDEDRVDSVAFENVVSFVDELDCTVDVPGLGEVRYDLAFGGAYYAFCQAADFDLPLNPDGFRQSIDLGTRIKQAIMKKGPIHHPVSEDLGFLYGTIFVGEPGNPAHHSRNICVFADGEVDRSPTGTGVSARIALHHARGEIGLSETIVIESILGTTFEVEAVREASLCDQNGVIPRVTGKAFITGKAEFQIDPLDPLGHGFILR